MVVHSIDSDAKHRAFFNVSKLDISSNSDNMFSVAEERDGDAGSAFFILLFLVFGIIFRRPKVYCGDKGENAA